MEPNIFLHICCAPCLIYFCKYFKEEKIEWKGYFFNPNIYPEEEYNKRLDCLQKFVSENNYSVDFRKGASRRAEFIEKSAGRCLLCYEWRLKETALQAKTEGFQYFSTTLLISPYQNHNKIKEIGDKIAKEYNLIFYYKDFRPFFYEGKKLAKENNFYFQKYCGCML